MNNQEPTYQIIRFWDEDHGYKTEVVATGLSAEDAHAKCASGEGYYDGYAFDDFYTYFEEPQTEEEERALKDAWERHRLNLARQEGKA